ncbi:MAG: hypothetical protein OHK0029_40980 [Armatimonadaceae bacterium]
MMPHEDNNAVRTSKLRKCIKVCIADVAADSLVYRNVRRKRHKAELVAAAEFANLLLESLGMEDAGDHAVKAMASSYKEVRRTLYRERRALTRIAYRIYRGKRI